jgi:hypothetical protein
MSRKKPVPDLIRDGDRFSGKDMRQSTRARTVVETRQDVRGSDRGSDSRDADARLTRQLLTAIAISVVATALALGLGLGAYFAFALLGLRPSFG